MNSPFGHLLIRADASHEIGTGHVMRTIALAEFWLSRNQTVAYTTAMLPTGLRNRIESLGIAIFDLDIKASEVGSDKDALQTKQICKQHKAHFLVIDGYQFAGRYQQLLRDDARTQLIIDDYCHLENYDCDIILNQNLGADQFAYNSSGLAPRMLLGTEFALIRSEFLAHKRRVKAMDSSDSRKEGALNMLISFGGSDPDNFSATAISAIKQCNTVPKLNVRLLVGSSHGKLDSLQSQAESVPNVEVLSHVEEMASQYEWADIALVAGGSTNWELCYFGLPRLIVTLAENQEAIARQLASQDSALRVGSSDKVTASELSAAIEKILDDDLLRSRLAENSRKLIDGRGAARVANALALHAWSNGVDLPFASGDMFLRLATIEDSERLLVWRNDEQTRMASRNQNPVSQNQHEAWFRKTLEGSRRLLFIAEKNSGPVGTVRIDFTPEIELSWTVAPAARGQGIGKQMVGCLCENVTFDLCAFVHPENVGSQKIAEANDFKRIDQDDKLILYRRPFFESNA